MAMLKIMLTLLHSFKKILFVETSMELEYKKLLIKLSYYVNS